MTRIATLVVVILAAAAAPVHAGAEERWYGLPIIGTDAAAVMLGGFASGASNNELPLAAAALSVYTLGPRVVHLVHGQPGAAAASVGARAVFPAGLGLIGFVAGGFVCEDDPDGFCNAIGAGVGMALGAGAALYLEHRYLARESHGPSVIPTVAFSAGAPLLSIAGRF
jgi:hypothetical protein